MVYEQVALNWISMTDPEEKAIMVEYARLGKLKSICYVGTEIVFYYSLSF